MPIVKTVAELQRALAHYEPSALVLRRASAENLAWLVPNVEIVDAGELYEEAPDGKKVLRKYIAFN